MIRCPFNNFSKCDGSCPFSMPDYSSCRLSTALIAIEGVCRGQLSKLDSSNAILKDVRTSLQAIEQDIGAPVQTRQQNQQKKGTKKLCASDTSRTRLVLKRTSDGHDDARLVIDEPTTDLMRVNIGDTCNYMVDSNGSVLVCSGKNRRLIKTGKNSTVCMQSDSQALHKGLNVKGDAICYMDVSRQGTFFVFTPTGEVEYA